MDDTGPAMGDGGDAGPRDAAAATDAPLDAPLDGGPPAFLGTVEERVDHLGITRTTLGAVGGTAFRDFEGNELMASANPLGSSLATLRGAQELYVVGVSPFGGGSFVDLDRTPRVFAEPVGALELATDPVPLAVHADADGREEMLVLDPSEKRDPCRSKTPPTLTHRGAPPPTLTHRGAPCQKRETRPHRR